jgi:putative transcriptional regulator
MLERIELLYQARNVFREGGYILNEHPYRSGSFDFVAKRTRIFIVKVILNLESVAGQHAVELLLISNMLDATPILLGARANNSSISDGVVYERHGILALNLHTLRELLLEDQIPTKRAKRGGRYTNISPRKLRELRMKRSISLRDVARSLDLSVKAIRSYESGDAIPTDENAEKLRNLLGDDIIKPVALFDRKEQPLPRDTLTPKNDLQREVQARLIKLDVDVWWFDSAPVDAICHTKPINELRSSKDSAMITGVAPSISPETLRRMNNALTIAWITDNQAFFILDDETTHKEIKPPLPTFCLSHLEQMNDQKELLKNVRRKGRKKPQM